MKNMAQKKFLPAVLAVGLMTGLFAVSAPAATVAKTSATPASAASIPPIKSSEIALHRALYDFRLSAVQSGAGISGIEGKMYYEQDDNCDAWTTDHRFSVEYQYPERAPVENTSHYVAYESKDAKQFYYSSEREENGNTVEQLRGAVKAQHDGTAKAAYSRPDNLSYDLPKGYLLPTQHTFETVRHAKAGDKFFNAVMFDGTDADGPVEINAFIGNKLTPDELKKLVGGNDKIDTALLSGDAWHVQMAVFPLKEDKAMAPAYEMELILHANGVVSWSLVDYRSFKVEQKLVALEKLPAKTCR